MSKSNNDLIAQALEINPLVVPPKAIVVQERDPMITKLYDDAEYVRDNLRKLIDEGMVSAKLCMDVAASLQDPKAFIPVAGMLSTLKELGEGLIQLHKDVRDAAGGSESTDAPETINNNLFVGTTEEALKMIRQRREDNGSN